MSSISLASVIMFIGLLAWKPALVNADPKYFYYLCNGVEFTSTQAEIQVSYAYTVKNSRTSKMKTKYDLKSYPLEFNQLGYSKSYIFPIDLNSGNMRACVIHPESKANAPYGCPFRNSSYMVVMDDLDNLQGMVWRDDNGYHHCEEIEDEGSDISVASLASD